jgi:hypothetical protein
MIRTFLLELLDFAAYCVRATLAGHQRRSRVRARNAVVSDYVREVRQMRGGR